MGRFHNYRRELIEGEVGRRANPPAVASDRGIASTSATNVMHNIMSHSRDYPIRETTAPRPLLRRNFD